jgi:PIN domain nuclease of toxin-antitoxin system
MRLLLDTHVLLWWLADDPQLGSRTRAIIAEPEQQVLVSVVSLWEARIKQSLGKLELPTTFREAIAEQGFHELAVLGEHTDELLRLPNHHRDPFDRLLVAQARGVGLTLVTGDENIARYDVARVDARL